MVTMVTRHRGDRFAVYSKIESLCCVPETNVVSIILQLKRFFFQHLLGTGFHYASVFTKFKIVQILYLVFKFEEKGK